MDKCYQNTTMQKIDTQEIEKKIDTHITKKHKHFGPKSQSQYLSFQKSQKISSLQNAKDTVTYIFSFESTTIVEKHKCSKNTKIAKNILISKHKGSQVAGNTQTNGSSKKEHKASSKTIRTKQITRMLTKKTF